MVALMNPVSISLQNSRREGQRAVLSFCSLNLFLQFHRVNTRDIGFGHGRAVYVVSHLHGFEVVRNEDELCLILDLLHQVEKPAKIYIIQCCIHFV